MRIKRDDADYTWSDKPENEEHKNYEDRPGKWLMLHVTGVGRKFEVAANRLARKEYAEKRKAEHERNGDVDHIGPAHLLESSTFDLRRARSPRPRPSQRGAIHPEHPAWRQYLSVALGIAAA